VPNFVSLSVKSEALALSNTSIEYPIFVETLLHTARTRKFADERTARMYGGTLDVPFVCGGIEIPLRLDCIRYLGIWIDRLLRFNFHVEKLESALRPVLRRLERLNDLLPSQLHQIYSGVGLARLTYAIHAWWPHLSDTAKDRLDSLHGLFARAITHTMVISGRNARLHAARLYPLYDIAEKAGFRRAAQLQCLRPLRYPAVEAVLAPANPAGVIARNTLGPCFSTAYVLASDPPVTFAREPAVVGPGLDPAAVGPAARVSIVLMPKGTRKSKDDNAANLAANKTQLAGPVASETFCDASVLTDASGAPIGAAAFAAFYASADVAADAPTATASVALNRLFCSFSAEEQGVICALRLLYEQLLARVGPAPPVPALQPHRLVTDSLSTLSTLALGPLRQKSHSGMAIWRWMLAVALYAPLQLVFIFSHCDHLRSNFVDEGAKHAATPPRGNAPAAPTWWADVSRAQWSPRLRQRTAERLLVRHNSPAFSGHLGLATFLLASGIIARSPENIGLLRKPPPFPSHRTSGRARLASQLIVGQIGDLPWKSAREGVARCPLCHNLGLHYYTSVIHMFECPSIVATSARTAILGQKDEHYAKKVFTDMDAAVEYTVAFLKAWRNAEVLSDDAARARNAAAAVAARAPLDPVVAPVADAPPPLAPIAPRPVDFPELPRAGDSPLDPLVLGSAEASQLPDNAPAPIPLVGRPLTNQYLSQAQAAIVDAVVQKHGNSKIHSLNPGGFPLKALQIQRLLAPGRRGWLASTDVDHYMFLINAQCPRALCLPTMVSDSLSVPARTIASVLELPRLIPAVFRSPATVMDHDMYMFPIHLADHWTLLVVVPGSGAWHFDSLLPRAGIPAVVPRLLEFAQGLRTVNDPPICSAGQVAAVVPNVNQSQSNAHDCGVFACVSARHFALTGCATMTVPLWLRPCVPRIRHFMALELIQHGLILDLFAQIMHERL
jgi:hypothetical protein